MTSWFYWLVGWNYDSTDEPFNKEEKQDLNIIIPQNTTGEIETRMYFMNEHQLKQKIKEMKDKSAKKKKKKRKRSKKKK